MTLRTFKFHESSEKAAFKASSIFNVWPLLPARRLPALQIRLNSRPLCAIQVFLLLYCTVLYCIQASIILQPPDDISCYHAPQR